MLGTQSFDEALPLGNSSQSGFTLGLKARFLIFEGIQLIAQLIRFSFQFCIYGTEFIGKGTQFFQSCLLLFGFGKSVFSFAAALICHVFGLVKARLHSCAGILQRLHQYAALLQFRLLLQQFVLNTAQLGFSQFRFIIS